MADKLPKSGLIFEGLYVLRCGHAGRLRAGGVPQTGARTLGTEGQAVFPHASACMSWDDFGGNNETV